MPVRLRDKSATKAEEAEVSNCVSNLIQAFTNGLNVFKRLRDRRKKRKSKKENEVAEPATSPESELSRSLRRGPQELAQRYDECFATTGQSFAKGDVIAHASLAETLIRLNTGLVAIITSFLNHDTKTGKSHLNLDYKSLTNLSDNSRREALQSMTQLYVRLSQSQLQLHQLSIKASCPHCGSSKHLDCNTRSSSNSSSSSSSSSKDKKRQITRQRVTGPTITRMPLKSSSRKDAQLVVIRPKPSSSKSSSSRKNSTSSSSSTKSNSPSSSAFTSPLSSPLPLAITESSFEFEDPASKPLSGHGRRRKDSFNMHDVSRGNDTWPADWKYPSFPPAHLHLPTPQLPTFTSTPRQSVTPRRAPPPLPTLPSKSASVPVPAAVPWPSSPSVIPSTTSSSSKPLPHAYPTASSRRRLDKQTPSSYTFASDSTKLGEIPQRNWTVPWDAEEAERLNSLAAQQAAATVLAGVLQTGLSDAEEKRARKGLFRWMKKERIIP